MAAPSSSSTSPLRWTLAPSVRATIRPGVVSLTLTGATPGAAYTSYAPLSDSTTRYVEVAVTKEGSAPYSAFSRAHNFAVGLGLAFGGPGTIHDNARMPGWEASAIGVHSDDGGLYMGKPSATKQVKPPFHGVGRIMGVGVFPPGSPVAAGPSAQWRLFFTVDGEVVHQQDLGERLDASRLQVALGLMGEGVEVAVNSGSLPFKWWPATGALTAPAPAPAPSPAPEPRPDVPVPSPFVAPAPAPTAADVAVLRERVAQLEARLAVAEAHAQLLNVTLYPALPDKMVDDGVVTLSTCLAALRAAQDARRAAVDPRDLRVD